MILIYINIYILDTSHANARAISLVQQKKGAVLLLGQRFVFHLILAVWVLSISKSSVMRSGCGGYGCKKQIAPGPGQICRSSTIQSWWPCFSLLLQCSLVMALARCSGRIDGCKGTPSRRSHRVCTMPLVLVLGAHAL